MVGLSYSDKKNLGTIANNEGLTHEMRSWAQSVLDKDEEYRENSKKRRTEKIEQKILKRQDLILTYLKVHPSEYYSVSELGELLNFYPSTVGRDLKYLLENGYEGKIVLRKTGKIVKYHWKGDC